MSSKKFNQSMAFTKGGTAQYARISMTKEVIRSKSMSKKFILKNMLSYMVPLMVPQMVPLMVPLMVPQMVPLMVPLMVPQLTHLTTSTKNTAIVSSQDWSLMLRHRLE